MFENKDYDELDDYKMEQESIRKEKSSGTSKANKIKKAIRQEMPDGTIVYKDPGQVAGDIAIWLIVLLGIGLPLSIAVSGGHLSNKGDLYVSYLLLIGFVVSVISSIIRKAFGKSGKSVSIKDNDVIVKTSNGRKLVYSCRDYEGMQCTRHYGKNHNYTSTTYRLKFNTEKGEEVVGFCSRRALVASDCNYEINSRKHGYSPDYEEIPDKEFKLPESLGRLRQNEPMVARIVGAAMAFMAFGMISTEYASYGRVTADALPLVAVFAIMGIVFVYLSFQDVARFGSPKDIKFIGNEVYFDDTKFNASEIKAVVVTMPGWYDPSKSYNSSIRIITSEGEYVYILGRFYKGMAVTIFKGSDALHEWPFEDFYSYIKKWCKNNSVKFEDLMM